MSGFHPDDPGSTPGWGNFFFLFNDIIFKLIS